MLTGRQQDKIKSLLNDLNSGLVDSKYCSQAEANIINKKCKFSLLCVNIRSLNANFDKLNELLTNYDILPDIIAISETKLELLQVYNAKLKGYHFYHKGTTTRWGGVGLFIKESLSISIQSCQILKSNIYQILPKKYTKYIPNAIKKKYTKYIPKIDLKQVTQLITCFTHVHYFRVMIMAF